MRGQLYSEAAHQQHEDRHGLRRGLFGENEERARGANEATGRSGACNGAVASSSTNARSSILIAQLHFVFIVETNCLFYFFVLTVE